MEMSSNFLLRLFSAVKHSGYNEISRRFRVSASSTPGRFQSFFGILSFEWMVLSFSVILKDTVVEFPLR